MFLARQFHTTLRRFNAYPLSKKGKPLTPYIAFTQTIRQEVVREHPDAKVPEIGKLLGKRWNELSEAEKQAWKDKYAEAKGE